MNFSAGLLFLALSLGQTGDLASEMDWFDLEVPVRGVEDGKARWIGSLSAALAEAKIRRAPIVVIMGHDTSDPLDYMLSTVYLSTPFAKTVRNFVPLIALQGKNHETEVDENRPGSEAKCKLFGVSCEDHDEAYQVLFTDLVHRTFWNPLLLVIDPDGNEVIRLEGSKHSFSRIQEELQYAASVVAKKYGSPMKEREYRKLLDAVARVREAKASGDFSKALRDLANLVKAKNQTDGSREFLADERTAVLAEGTRLVLETMRKAGGDRKAALARIRKLARDFAGTDVEEQAKRAEAKLQEEG